MSKNTQAIVGIIVVLVVAGIVWRGATSTSSSTTSTSTASSTPSYTLADVAKHNTASNCWTAINGNVYDVTAWINRHPGGADAILSICGIDGSGAFNGQHGGQARPASELANFKIGIVSK